MISFKYHYGYFFKYIYSWELFISVNHSSTEPQKLLLHFKIITAEQLEEESWQQRQQTIVIACTECTVMHKLSKVSTSGELKHE